MRVQPSGERKVDRTKSATSGQWVYRDGVLKENIEGDSQQQWLRPSAPGSPVYAVSHWLELLIDFDTPGAGGGGKDTEDEAFTSLPLVPLWIADFAAQKKFVDGARRGGGENLGVVSDVGQKMQSSGVANATGDTNGPQMIGQPGVQTMDGG